MPTTDEVCDTCGAPMVFRRGRFGEFLACSRYPECKTTRPISLGVICPREGCGGFIAEKRSKRGKSFYGCSNYSKTGCDFVLWDRPVGETCPGCGARFMVRKGGRRGGGPGLLRCVRDGCGYVEPGEGMTAGTAEAEARAEAKAEATAG
jgi:DNA topoisomerase-1